MPPVVSMVGPKTPKSESNGCAHEVNQNIQVFVRCRPLKSSEKKSVVDVVSDRKEVRVCERGVSMGERYATKTFTFDNAFGADTEQLEVYRSVVEPLIEQVVMGYNCTVFAYGQTGTGKTYTMEGERTGDESQYSWESDPLCGIIPRALHQLFETLQSQTNEHTVRVSFLELYNEELYDLLSAIDDTTKLKIYEDSVRKGSTIVGGLEEITVQSKSEIYEILRKGSSKRQTAATLLNACSSRSHTIFSVTVHIKESSIEGEDMVKIGKLNLVDLAGSENIGRSGAIDKRAREAGNINQSLLTLGRVITCLVEKAPHIPYRESKLTRLLQDSLGGRTKTSIIATISPHILDAEDTLSTLEYAQRAKKITNKPEINQKMSKKTLLREYTAEIERLRRDLAACREKNGFYINEDNYNAMQEQIKSLNEEMESKSAQIQALTSEFEKMSSLFENTKEELEIKCGELEVTHNTLKMTDTELKQTKNTLLSTQTERNEQKHLVEKHVDSEKMLSSQAKQLLSVADQTVTDVEKLHAKVDRHKNIDTINKLRTDDFLNKFREEMKRMEELVGVTTSSYNDNLDELKNTINDKFNKINEVVDDVQKSITSFSKLNSDHCSQMSSLHLKDRISLEQSIMLRDKNHDIVTTIDASFGDFNEKVDVSHASLNEKMQSIVTTVSQQKLGVEELIMKQNTYLNDFTRLIQSSFEQIRNDMQLCFEAYSNEIVFYKSEIERIKSERINSKKQIDQKWNQLEKLMSDIKVEQIKENVEFEKFSTVMIDKLNDAHITHQNNVKQLTARVDDNCGKIVSEQKEALNYIEKVDDLTTKKTQEVIDSCDNILKTCEDMSADTKATFNSAKDVIIKKANESILLNEDLIKLNDKQLSAKQIALSDLNDKFNIQLDSQKEMAVNISCTLEKTSEAVTEKSCEINRMLATMEKSQVREIENRFKELERFLKNEILIDKPTGVTPEKTSYSYPRNLVQTSPHERILERYRAVIERDATWAPLPEESDSEFFSDSNTSVLSSASTSANIENIPINLTLESSKSRALKSKSVSDIKINYSSIKNSESDKLDNKGMKKCKSRVAIRSVPFKAHSSN